MGKKTYEQNDNTRVQRPIVQQYFTRKAPSQEEQQEMAKQGYSWDGKNWRYVGTISDKGGKPSTDTRTAEQRNKDYLHPTKGAWDRWVASWVNGTNPVKGALDTGLAYTNPVTAVGNAVYDAYNAYDQLSSPQGLAKTWGLFRQGNLGRAAASAAGDVLAAADLIPGMPETPSVRAMTTPEIRVPHSGEFIGETVIPPMNITDGPIDMASVRHQQQLNTLRDLLGESRVAPTREELLNSAPSGSFENQLQYLINNVTNPHDVDILRQMQSGDWGGAEWLWGPEYNALANVHPDSRFLNSPNRFQQLAAIQALRNGFSDGLAPSGETVLRALGTNPYDDNPLIAELGVDNFTNNYNILPASVRTLFENEWNPANNHIIQNMMNTGTFVAPSSHPYSQMARRFSRNSQVPLEYRHLDTDTYDSSYPLEHYTGVDTPDGLTTQQLLENGLLGNTSGLFTEEQLLGLPPEVLDKFMRRSYKLDVEGAHGNFFNPHANAQKQALQYLLTKGQENSSIMESLKKSNRSGYVNFPHSLSIDSWPIWELQSLRHSGNTVPIPLETFEKTDLAKHNFPYKNGIPQAMTNSYGIGNRIEASPELQQFLKQNTNSKLTPDDFTITRIDDQTSGISYNGTNIGTLKMLNNQETLDKFNQVRRRLYRRDPSKYPGDATLSSQEFRYIVPFIPTQLKKEGGKLNVRLVKRTKKQD